MDASEFNLTIRSLASFFKSHKSIGLVILDGLHFIENLEYLALQEKKLMNEANKEKNSTSHNIHMMAEEMGDDVPNMADFFGDNTGKNKDSDPITDHKRKSLILPTRTKRDRNLDSKAFDQKLVDRALSLLLDF